MGENKQGEHVFSSMATAEKRQYAWKTRSYPVPMASKRGFRWKASALRTLPWIGGTTSVKRVTVMVPALYSVLPAEAVALGWLNEIDALAAIHQRMICSSKLTGWDVFTFHTLHNQDSFFNSTIAAVHDTWLKEGTLSREAVLETQRQFSKPYDYHRIMPRLVENLVFQTSVLDWMTRRASDVPLRLHAIGTALLSVLVSSGSITFEASVTSAMKFGKRWDDAVSSLAEGATTDEIGWARFQQIRQLIEGRSTVNLGVSREDMPLPNAPSKPFWYSPTPQDPAVLISTAQEAKLALETMNLSSWSCSVPLDEERNVRGWLASPLHPIAKACRWSVSNYLLATPDSATLFLDHIATLGRAPVIYHALENVHRTPEKVQNRFRLSRIKVTGP
jgi:hypothetical protein